MEKKKAELLAAEAERGIVGVLLHEVPHAHVVKIGRKEDEDMLRHGGLELRVDLLCATWIVRLFVLTVATTGRPELPSE